MHPIAAPEMVWPFVPLPTPPTLVEVAFDPHGFEPAEFARHGIERPAELAAAVPVRQTEFLAGRLCARRALALAGMEVGEVPRGSDRAPMWPVGVVGSIAHARGVATAVVAPQSRFDALGIDLEGVIDPARAAEVAALVATEAELARVGDGGTLAREAALTLVFSLKESLFKALYPQVRRLFEFEDAEVVVAGDGRARLRLLRTLAPGLPADTEFPALYALGGGMVRSLVYRRAAG